MTRSLRLNTAASLERAFAVAAPRLSPQPTPPASLAIHGLAAALFLAACICALVGHGLAAWAPGLVYVAYEALLGVLVLAMAARGGGHSETDAARPTVAVVVAAHDEAEALPLTLQALLAQDDAPDAIVVADDGSRDDTATLLIREFGFAPPPLGAMAASATRPSLHWLRLPHGGKARALNAALLAVDTEIMITVDADTRIEPGAVAAVRNAFGSDPRLVAAGGALVPTCAATRLGRWMQACQRGEYARNTLSFAAWARLGMLLHIPGAFAGFRRTALLAVGGFDPAALVEDYELIHRLRRYGALQGLDWTTSLVDACATTDAPPTIATFLRQRRRWFCGFLETQLWYRDMAGAPRFGRIGSLMLPIKAFDTLQPLLGLLALALLPVLVLRGRWTVLAIAAALIAGKAVLDLAIWWQAARRRRGPRAGLAATLVGALPFEMMRHLGAALGWIAFLTGDRAWRPQARTGLVAARDTDGIV